MELVLDEFSSEFILLEREFIKLNIPDKEQVVWLNNPENSDLLRSELKNVLIGHIKKSQEIIPSQLKERLKPILKFDQTQE